METYSMGKVVIERHSFFMGMYANEVTLVSIRDAGNGTRVAKLTGALGCATEAARRRGAWGRERRRSRPSSILRPPMAVMGAGQRATASPSRSSSTRQGAAEHAIFGPNPTFTGEMIAGEITIDAPPLPLIAGTPTP